MTEDAEPATHCWLGTGSAAGLDEVGHPLGPWIVVNKPPRNKISPRNILGRGDSAVWHGRRPRTTRAFDNRPEAAAMLHARWIVFPSRVGSGNGGSRRRNRAPEPRCKKEQPSAPVAAEAVEAARCTGRLRPLPGASVPWFVPLF